MTKHALLLLLVAASTMTACVHTEGPAERLGRHIDELGRDFKDFGDDYASDNDTGTRASRGNYENRDVNRDEYTGDRARDYKDEDRYYDPYGDTNRW